MPLESNQPIADFVLETPLLEPLSCPHREVTAAGGLTGKMHCETMPPREEAAVQFRFLQFE